LVIGGVVATVLMKGAADFSRPVLADCKLEEQRAHFGSHKMVRAARAAPGEVATTCAVYESDDLLGSHIMANHGSDGRTEQRHQVGRRLHAVWIGRPDGAAKEACPALFNSAKNISTDRVDDPQRIE